VRSTVVVRSPFGPVVVVVVVVVVRSHTVQSIEEPPPGCWVVLHRSLAAVSAARMDSEGPVAQADSASPVARTVQNRSMVTTFPTPV